MSAISAAAAAAAPGGAPGAAVRRADTAPRAPEDLPGVPASAFRLVRHPLPAEAPYQMAEGFVLCVDGARFLPAQVTICRAVVLARPNPTTGRPSRAPDMKP
jgi:hypothetical protein